MLESVSEKNRFQLPLFVLLSFPTFTLLLERNPLWKHSTSLFSVYWQFVFNVLVILHWNWINDPLGSHFAKIIHIETTIAWPFPSEKREKASERKIVASWNSFTFKQSVQVHRGTEMRESTEPECLYSKHSLPTSTSWSENCRLSYKIWSYIGWRLNRMHLWPIFPLRW